LINNARALKLQSICAQTSGTISHEVRHALEHLQLKQLNRVDDEQAI